MNNYFTKEQILSNSIAQIMLAFADLKDDMDTSDFQGYAEAQSRDIIEMVKQQCA